MFFRLIVCLFVCTPLFKTKIGRFTPHFQISSSSTTLNDKEVVSFDFFVKWRSKNANLRRQNATKTNGEKRNQEGDKE